MLPLLIVLHVFLTSGKEIAQTLDASSTNLIDPSIGSTQTKSSNSVPMLPTTFHFSSRSTYNTSDKGTQPVNTISLRTDETSAASNCSDSNFNQQKIPSRLGTRNIVKYHFTRMANCSDVSPESNSAPSRITAMSSSTSFKMKRPPPKRVSGTGSPQVVTKVFLPKDAGQSDTSKRGSVEGTRRQSSNAPDEQVSNVTSTRFKRPEKTSQAVAISAVSAEFPRISDGTRQETESGSNEVISISENESVNISNSNPNTNTNSNSNPNTISLINTVNTGVACCDNGDSTETETITVTDTNTNTINQALSNTSPVNVNVDIASSNTDTISSTITETLTVVVQQIVFSITAFVAVVGIIAIQKIDEDSKKSHYYRRLSHTGGAPPRHTAPVIKNVKHVYHNHHLPVLVTSVPEKKKKHPFDEEKWEFSKKRLRVNENLKDFPNRSKKLELSRPKKYDERRLKSQLSKGSSMFSQISRDIKRIGRCYASLKNIAKNPRRSRKVSKNQNRPRQRLATVSYSNGRLKDKAYKNSTSQSNLFGEGNVEKFQQ